MSEQPVVSFSQRFYKELLEYQTQYGLRDEFVGFALGYVLFQPVIASADIPELLDTAKEEYTRVKDGIDARSR